ncbi:eukaryotic translation initiation factor 4E-binding protein 1-like [Dromiciops gliroides]|uniref:eukaryotic translation initiation factor 4E-binding protein 1-like n=1 Tax=Dromiciops gliroides TaxID=33562 RepID=UPI001CC5D79D|nr:eukaryotic translation initiation factor 4E-binding protein 1-like [Dromiciops gliroides]
MVWTKPVNVLSQCLKSKDFFFVLAVGSPGRILTVSSFYYTILQDVIVAVQGGSEADPAAPGVRVCSEAEITSAEGSCSQTPNRAIPATLWVVLRDSSQLPPGDYNTTPGGTLFSTTPGGTRIIYDRNFLKECHNSPVAKTPPRDLPTISGVTSPFGDEPATEMNPQPLPNSHKDKPGSHEESQLEMDI